MRQAFVLRHFTRDFQKSAGFWNFFIKSSKKYGVLLSIKSLSSLRKVVHRKVVMPMINGRYTYTQ